MKRILSLLILVWITIRTMSQELPLPIQQQLENEAVETEQEVEDDEYLQQFEFFRKHPIPINTALKEDLQRLRILTEYQVRSILQYRKLMGPLVNIYELQAVPGWDLETIMRITPYLTLTIPFTIKESRNRFSVFSPPLPLPLK